MCIRDRVPEGRRVFPRMSVEDNLLLGAYARKDLSLIHISEPTSLLSISYAVFCLKKNNKQFRNRRSNKNTAKKKKNQTRTHRHNCVSWRRRNLRHWLTSIVRRCGTWTRLPIYHLRQ